MGGRRTEDTPTSVHHNYTSTHFVSKNRSCLMFAIRQSDFTPHCAVLISDKYLSIDRSNICTGIENMEWNPLGKKGGGVICYSDIACHSHSRGTVGFMKKYVLN